MRKRKDMAHSLILPEIVWSNSRVTQSRNSLGNSSSTIGRENLRIERCVIEFIEMGLASCRRWWGAYLPLRVNGMWFLILSEAHLSRDRCFAIFRLLILLVDLQVYALGSTNRTIMFIMTARVFPLAISCLLCSWKYLSASARTQWLNPKTDHFGWYHLSEFSHHIPSWENAQ